MIFTNNRERVRAIWATKYKKYVAGKHTRTSALVEQYTNRILESKDGTKSIKYLIILKETTLD